MRILFIGKRFYTNRDALTERFGRIYQMPWFWAKARVETHLWLIDYYTDEELRTNDGPLEITSTPVFRLVRFWRWWPINSTRFFPVSPSKIDIVVGSGDCYIGLLAYVIARITGAKFVFDIYDKYDEFGAYRRIIGFDPFAFLIRYADYRLFASEALSRATDDASGRNFLVPNGIDADKFYPRDMRESRRALGLPERTIFVGYFGSMEPERGVEDLIEAVMLLRGNKLRLEVLISGKANKDIDLRRPGVRYIGDIHHSRMPLLLASCNVLALPYRTSKFIDMASSCKIAEYLSAGRPIVATRSPSVMINFPDEASELNRYLVEPEDIKGLANSIRMQIREKYIVGVTEKLSWSRIATNLLTILRNDLPVRQ